MVNKNIYIILKRLLILGLPVLFIIFVNVAAGAHLKNFCLIKLLTGHECWGCGLTRAFAALTHFQFIQAYNYNHLVIIIAPLLFIIWVIFVRDVFYSK